MPSSTYLHLYSVSQHVACRWLDFCCCLNTKIISRGLLKVHQRTNLTLHFMDLLQMQRLMFHSLHQISHPKSLPQLLQRHHSSSLTLGPLPYFILDSLSLSQLHLLTPLPPLLQLGLSLILLTWAWINYRLICLTLGVQVVGVVGHGPGLMQRPPAGKIVIQGVLTSLIALHMQVSMMFLLKFSL
jgi:hypothetical protein